jgi:tetratricopeptide (TPR) repeat protein
LFISLAVFSHGFSVDAAEQVCSNQDQPADLVEQLASLVDKSLLIREEVRKQARLRMLETIHEYCNWHFRESREVELIQERHAGYFLRFAERAAYELRGPRLEMENGNLQAAMDWSLAKNKIPEALRFGVALRWFWYRSGYLSYGRRYLQRALAVTPEAIVLRERALHALGWLEFVQGNWSQAGSLYREGLRLAHKLKDREGQCLLLSHLGVCERWLGQRKSGTAHVEQAVRMARRLVNSDLLGTALIWAYGTTGGRFEDRAPLAELVEAVDLCRRTGDLWGVSSALNGLGDLYRELGNWQQARPPYEEALAGFRELKDRWMTAWTLEGLGRAAQLAGEHRKAGRCFREALELFRLLGDRGNTAFMLNRLAFLARAQGNHNRAACLLAASANLQSSLLSPEAARRLQQETELAKATAEYKSAYAASWVRGQTMALELAIGFAKTTSKA